MENTINLTEETEKGEIVFFQPDTTSKILVHIENDTVRLPQAGMAELFQTKPQNITMHIKNIYKENELNRMGTCKDFLQVQYEGKRAIKRNISHYNLDVIISVGYRIKSPRGTMFRIRAMQVIKDYMFKGIAIHKRIERLEYRISKNEEKLDFFIEQTLPAKEGIFYEGQVFDAYSFVANLIKSAKQRTIVFDNYIDESVLLLFSKREKGVSATIYTANISPALQNDIQKYNAQYPAITVKIHQHNHDRFLIIDDEIYHIGASIKDVGKKLFAFSKMEIKADEFLKFLQ